jgi:hypothetical protein
MYVCPSCHLEQQSQDGFCRDCGTQVITLRYCDSCGVKTRGAEDFCRECGTKLGKIQPFALKSAPTASPTPTPVSVPIEDNPKWLKDRSPSRADTADEPAWLKDSPKPSQRSNPSPSVATKTRTDNNERHWLHDNASGDILTPRPNPVARTHNTQRTTTPNGNVQIRRPAVPTDSRTRNLQGLLGLLLAMLGIVTAANGGFFVMGLIMIVLSMVVGGKPLFELMTSSFHRVVDWIWEDPVLRKRMLDE